MRRLISLLGILTSISLLFLYTNTMYPVFIANYYPEPCGVACEVNESAHFLIQTPTCAIPYFSPSHKSIVKYRRTTPKKIECGTKRSLTEVEGLYLHFYKDRVSDYDIPLKQLNCSYNGIRRIEQKPNKYDRKCDKKSKLMPSIPIYKEMTPIDEDGIFVVCSDSVKKKDVYKNVHYFIQPRRVQGKREKFKREEGQKRLADRKLNVVIMGTDAVSRGNLERHMPKTFHYLKDNLGAFDFRGFTKVADNTEPNMVAALMGLTYEELNKHKCRAKGRYNKFDDCPLIWKEFSEQGYATAMGEDCAWMSLFHYNKLGFVKEPVDYYNRPYFLVSEDRIGSKDLTCQGNKRSIDVIHDYSLSLAEALKDIPHFGFFWTASLTHDVLEMASAADEPSLRYLKEFDRNGFLQNTALFFISDHGLRWGSFRSTYAGMLEERLPYVMLVLPPWFREEYPEAWTNLHTNTQRLTSTFDIYVTVKDILYQKYRNISRQPPTASLHGQSLFLEVPLERTCSDASVPEHYCVCQFSKQIQPDDPRLQAVAQFAVDKLNEALKAFPKCAPLRLMKVISGRIKTATKSTIPKKMSSVAEHFTITFITVPGEAHMESTVKRYDNKYQIISEVSRINQYGNQSHCISDFTNRKYCFCKDLL